MCRIYETICIALHNASDPFVFLIVIVGMSIGIIFGALPGLTSVMGLILVLPFTLDMEMYEGLILLGSVYAGATYGGSVSAILIRTPGAPANIATMFDGYPMAQKGESRQALTISVICSAVGGMFGVFTLIFLAPQLAKLALKFGPAEVFWVMIFSMTVIVSLASGNIIKGLIAGAFGLLLGTVGLGHEAVIQPRFTFGTSYFVRGIDVVCALIGYFAFSQGIALFGRTLETELPIEKIKRGLFWQMLKTVFTKYKWNTLRSAVIGTIIGIIPGAGGNVASMISYNEARRFSGKAEAFGKGEWGGVIASETANNATEGGALVPLLTLGIPGSPTAAVFLGGLIVHGVWPGPVLFSHHLDSVYTLFIGLILTQIAMLLLGHFGARYFALALKIPRNLLGLMIIVLCLFGAYSVSNSMEGILIMFCTGILGFFGERLGIPPAPVVIGLILSKRTEAAFIQSLLIGEARGSLLHYFLSSTICIILIGMTILSLSYVIYAELKSAKGK